MHQNSNNFLVLYEKEQIKYDNGISEKKVGKHFAGRNKECKTFERNKITDEGLTVRSKKPMNQIERIKYYESLLNEAEAVLKEFDRAFVAYVRIQGRIAELEKYYTSPEWKKDFEASEKGKLPEDLLCGVLSEDGIDHVLSDNLQLMKDSKRIEDQIKEASIDV